MPRPRDPDRDVAILRAASDLLGEVGYAELTIDAVAERAGVARPTVYRRYPSKPALVAAAIQDDPRSPRASTTDAPAAAPDTGSLLGDLTTLVSRLVRGFSAMEEHGAMGGIIAEMAVNPAFADDIRTRWLDPDEVTLSVVFRRAEERGELVTGVDGPAILSALAGTVIYRLVILHQPCPPAWQQALVARCIAGLPVA